MFWFRSVEESLVSLSFLKLRYFGESETIPRCSLVEVEPGTSNESQKGACQDRERPPVTSTQAPVAVGSQYLTRGG
jgi:hypothetical protein